MVDYLILGLLLLKSRTLYEIRSKLDNDMNMLYSSSTGSIQAAIKKLLEQSHITINEVSDGNKVKKYYVLTNEGEKAFNDWVDTDIQSDKMRNQELIKFYFMGLSNPELRKKRIEKHIEKLSQTRDNLKFIYEEGIKITPPNEYKDLLKYQLLTVKFGVDSVDFQIEWFYKMMNEI